MKLLFLEDEYALRISIEEFLLESGFEVDTFSNGDEAYEATFSHHYDLLLLDINVPGISGLELLESLRKENNTTPAIFLTSMTQMSDLQNGYAKGCCDYIRKPFDLTELLLRIQQALKSHYFSNDTKNIDLGEGLVYDTHALELHYKQKSISLSKTENQMIELLLKHKNQVVTMEMFQDEIWESYVDPTNIRVQINNLRKKVPIDFIKNRRGLGYIIER